MDIQPINKKRKIYYEVFKQLQKLFKEDQFKSGDRLPSERELANKLNVSRNSLREALKVLEIFGLIEKIPGSGTYIRKTEDEIILSLAISLSLEQPSMMELMEVRQVIESECASLAANRAQEDDLYEIEKTLIEMDKVNNRDDWVQVDMRFHYQVAKAAKNKLFLRLLLTFIDHMSNTIKVIGSQRLTNSDKFKSTADEHKKIYYAIKNRDPNLAKELMEQHIKDSAAELKKIN